ncbi:MAG: phosphate ABC transporter permease PstA [Ardenticatenia bacterium]|nr:phosphate ABC transporter permease PstA [Ardenticatenia bacterium]
MSAAQRDPSVTGRPEAPLLRGQEGYSDNVTGRKRQARRWELLFIVSTLVGIVALGSLLYNVLDSAYGLVAIDVKVDPASLARGGVALEALPASELATLLREKLKKRDLKTIEKEQPLAARSTEDLLGIVQTKVVGVDVVGTWVLSGSLLRRRAIEAELARTHPNATLTFKSWLRPAFLSSQQSPDPMRSGVRSAILGSLWTILVTIVVALPLGVAAAVYLEEYAAKDRRLTQVIQTNINNLAGVPSIIYGMLGLTIFVRLLEPLTSGAWLTGATSATANGRTILSAGLTLALLVLPLQIINSQEAIRAVPGSLRQASYGLGATRWQTIWAHVLPSALPGVLTGTILSVSRAIGETAPLVVVGASTAIFQDPSGPFSKFTVLPIQIYQWTSRPQAEFRSIAAAAILVLLAMLLSLNAAAVFLRNRTQVRH